MGYRGAIVGEIGYTQDLQIGFGLGKSWRRYIISVNIGRFFNVILHDVHICQEQNNREQRSGVINRIILQNSVLYYFGE